MQFNRQIIARGLRIGFLRSQSRTITGSAVCRDDSDVSVDDLWGETMDYDCLVVGGGPAGLAAAIRLKQVRIDIIYLQCTCTNLPRL